MGSHLANIEQSAEVWFRKHGRQPRAEVPGEERGGSSSPLLPPLLFLSLMSTPLVRLNLRSLSLDN